MNIKRCILLLAVVVVANATRCPEQKECNCATTWSPSVSPTHAPSVSPSFSPTHSPSDAPSVSPTHAPSNAPTNAPSKSPSDAPSLSPSKSPTKAPSDAPTHAPSDTPSLSPSKSPTQSPFVCVRPLDLGFVIDNSGSIPKGGLDKAKAFAVEVVNSFTLGPEHAMFSVQYFSSNVGGLLSFSDNYQDIVNAIDIISNPKGSTFTGGAIKYFADTYLPLSRRFSKFMVLITDGVPTKGANKVNPVNYAIQQTEVMKAMYPSVLIITIGVGTFNKDFLRVISSKGPDREPLMYSINNFEDLDGIIRSLTELICYTDASLTQHPSRVPTEQPVNEETCVDWCSATRSKSDCTQRPNDCMCKWKKKTCKSVGP
jgi:hypothetical protein